MALDHIDINDQLYQLAGDVSELGILASKGFSVDVDGRPLEGFIVRSDDGELFAYKNSCPHTGAPLNWSPNQFLTTTGRYIQCSIHGAMFMLESGECFSGPCSGKFLQTIPVVEKAGCAYVALGVTA